MGRMIVGMLLVASLGLAGCDNVSRCYAIARTSDAALQPNDRMWYSEHCLCVQGDCVLRGSREEKEMFARAERVAKQKADAEADRKKAGEEWMRQFEEELRAKESAKAHHKK